MADQGRLLSDCTDYIGTVGSNPTLSANISIKQFAIGSMAVFL